MDVDHHKLETSPGASTEIRRRRSRRGRTICLSVLALVLALGIIILILALTVFKAKRPVTTVHSVSLRDLNFSLDIARLAVALNVTVDADLDIRNPNRVGFKYTDSTALLKYRGEVVGEVPIPAGKISAHQTTPMNITLTVMADRLLSNPALYSDIMSGTLLFQTYTRISGHVHILFKVHVVSYTTCDLYVDVSSRSLANQTCHYRTKL